MSSILQDLRIAARRLRLAPGFTSMALATLALGIGATTAIFSVVDAVILRPLPFPEPHRLVHVWEISPRGADFPASEPGFLDFRARNRSFEEMAAYRETTVTLTGEAGPERIEAMAVSHTLFPVVGATPQLGRTFVAGEDRPGGETRVAVLGHALWERRFGADPLIVGRRIVLDGQAHEVVGVMEPGFDFPDADLWIPLAANPGHDRDDHWLGVIGRLRPGVSPQEAQADLSGISRRIGEAHPLVAGWSVRVATFPEWMVGPQVTRTSFLLLGAVGFLLLIACANLANLLFARATARRTEFGVRAALGAGRSRLVRQLLTESALLALIGAALGVLGAVWAVEGLKLLDPGGIPRLDEVAVNGRVLAFSLVLALLTSLLFGLAPAVRASRVELAETLRAGGRGSMPGGRRVRDALVVTQIALAVVLLVGAGLLIRSFVQLQRVDPGFDPANVLAVRLQLAEYPESWQKVDFLNELTERLEQVPGIVSVGATAIHPFSDWNLSNNVTPEELAAETGPSGYLQAGWRVATPGFFRTMGIPVLRGRVFSAADSPDGPRVVVVTATLARRLWGDDDPVGKGLFWGGTDGTPLRVVGVVDDYRDVQLEAEPAPLIFLPYNQLPWPEMTVVVRTAGRQQGMAARIRDEIRSLSTSLPVPEIRPLEQTLSGAVAGPRFRTALLAFFSAVALVLAAVGIYGVMAFNVAQRSREIGVRLALGARPEALSLMVLRHGAWLTAFGVAAGIGGALILTRFLDGLLFDTAPTDVPTFVAVGLLLSSVALLASYLPARAATRVDPNLTLRAD